VKLNEYFEDEFSDIVTDISAKLNYKTKKGVGICAVKTSICAKRDKVDDLDKIS
jgi:hypothetical protein